MKGAAKILSVSTVLAVATAGLGLYGISDWDGEVGGHWVAIAGFTFLLPLFQTGSFVFATVCHFAACMTMVSAVWGITCLFRRPACGIPAVPNPIRTSEPPPDPWVPPNAEEITRVVHYRDDASFSNRPTA